VVHTTTALSPRYSKEAVPDTLVVSELNETYVISMAHYIKMLANIISKRLEEHCSDDDIVTSSSREEKSRMVDWELFLEDLKRVEDNTHKRSMLEQPIERTVQVKKDKDKENHRLYQIEDTILQKALRRSPPPNVLKELEMISPTYRISKQIYDLINAMTMGDDEWTEIKRILYRLTVSKIYGLTDAETKNVFRIRHGWREDTLLMISARRDPPLKVVRELLKGCRESIAIVDTALYDWIPLIYAIAYGAKPDVTKAMIPLKEDFDSLAPLQEHNFLEEVDVYNRTPLHWTVFYDAPLATIIALKEKTPSRALDTEDDLDMRPFELAISEGAAMEIVEALLPDSIPDFETVEMNIIRSFIYKKTKPSRRRTQKEGADEFEDHNVRAINKALEKEDEFADMKRYDASPKCIPYLAKQLAEKKSLQNLLIAKSCHTIPTFIMMLDFYACIMLLWSFRESSMHYLSGEEPSVSSLTWVHVLLFTASFMSFRELCQMCIGGMDWFLNLWNYFDVSTCILTIWCGLKMLANDTGSNFPTLVIWTTAFVWANALFFMRKTFLRFAIFVSGLISIIHDLIPFLVVSLLLLVAFGELYMVDSITNGECVNQGMGNGTSPFCTFQDGLFWTYALFVSGIEIQDFASTTAMRIISIAFGFFVTVILLNVIIAIVSNSWDSVNEQGKEVVSIWL
jgi:hypothetical protein